MIWDRFKNFRVKEEGEKSIILPKERCFLVEMAKGKIELADSG